MGADTKSLRVRIKSVNSTRHLTKAMGLVASSKIRRATDNMIKSQDFANGLSDVVDLLTSFPECSKSPYMTQHNGNKTTLVVIAGDRGLAGGYNANIFRFMRDYNDANVIPIGKRACDRFDDDFKSSEIFTWSDAIEIANNVCEDFVSGKIDKFGIVGTKYESIMTQTPELTWLLPLEKSDNKANQNVLLEQDKMEFLNSVMPEYIAGKLMAIVRESFASEVAARRMAMDSADKNAQEMISNLELEYNRARQSAITQEITEIVAGSGD